jgi:long-chain acyl-CoA synthetase
MRPMPLQDIQVAEAYAGKRIFFTGATGFVGKVVLSMLLDRYPVFGKLYVLVRPGTSGTAEDRFFNKIVRSRPFDPLRERHGDRFDEFLRAHVIPIAGDISKPKCGVSRDWLERLSRGNEDVNGSAVDLVINSAGLVDFNPSLEVSLNTNTIGVGNILDLCRDWKASLVHVSTCFVTGDRDGSIFEDEPLVGYFPKRDEVSGEDFDAEQEITDCKKLVERVKAQGDDHALTSEFRAKALERLRSESRNPDDERAVRLAIARERKVWISSQLVNAGMDRARQWGWPNTYTYTKSLGEQLIAKAKDVNSAIVRPAIVESAISFPFPGWNEGFNTSAPLAFVILKGHRTYPMNPKGALDIIPVDYVAGAILAVGAATAVKKQRPVYQVGTSDRNPLLVRRALELTGLYRRKFYREREKGSRFVNDLLAKIEPVAVSKDTFRYTSAPAIRNLMRGAKAVLDEVRPRWGTPQINDMVALVKRKLERVQTVSEQTIDLFDLFMPFVWEHCYVFKTDNIQNLYARLSEEDRKRIPYEPENIDWRAYWFDIHMDGLQKWVFPSLEEGLAEKPRTYHPYRDLVEMFDTAIRLYENRVAMRIDREGQHDRYTYADVDEYVTRGAAYLASRGIGPERRVLLASENRPEWAMSYFSILKTGGTAVPIDSQLSADEVVNLLKNSKAPVAVLSADVRDRLEGLDEALRAAGLSVELVSFEDLFTPRDLPAPSPEVHGEHIASLIYTSGTTGQPKGVMLSHRNFCTLLSKLNGVFELSKSDGVLSVLPLHHTFEFTCGLLSPFSRGAEITYLDELSSEALSDVLSSGRITAMVGVPALWQLLHRRIASELTAHGPLAEKAADMFMALNRAIREKTPFNLGWVFFWPVHATLGKGRMKFMISGGSALPEEVYKDFYGLGFSVFEGYGLTEAAPVLTVQTDGHKLEPGSVGEPLPGIELRINQPDEDGVGEVWAKGPNVMVGYFENPDATAEVLKDGWLRTGDLGYLDEQGKLHLVGRKKDVIIDANGKNVYPDEIEDLYHDSPYLRELCVVGLPDESGSGEKVACLAVPNYGVDAQTSRDEVRRKLENHFREVSLKLPYYKRIKALHLWDAELPKTATRKIKRKPVSQELKRLESIARAGPTKQDAASSDPRAWLYDLVAQVANVRPERVTASSRLSADLGFDSLMFSELGAALESAGVQLGAIEDVMGVSTVEDLARLVSHGGTHAPEKKAASPVQRMKEKISEEEITLPDPIAEIGRRILRQGQRAIYEQLFHVRVFGESYIPKGGNFIVTANHSSHLDMGLVKHALGPFGENLATLAAKDYFFDSRYKRAYFENLTNLIPMERHGSLKESLRLASEVLRRGHVLLIFPEGTRSPTGEMADFKASLGYLALTNQSDVLPMYLAGSHDALPKGSFIPRSRELQVHIGPVISHRYLKHRTQGLLRSEAYREASRILEEATHALRDGRPFVPPQDFGAVPETSKPVEPKAESGPKTDTLTTAPSLKGQG